MNEPISTKIINRLKQDNKRFFSCDNVSEYISEEERSALIDEVTAKFEAVLRSMVIDIDNDPNAMDTPRRLSKMYINELFEGRYYPSPRVTSFPNEGNTSYNGMIVIKVELQSQCAHHWQNVVGNAYIGIIPNEVAIGLSKYIRISQHIARRGTLQEEMTVAIKDAIIEASGTENVAVHVASRHGCVECRGVRAHDSLTQTTVLSGGFNKPDLKLEFFDNIKLQGSYSN